MKPTSTLLLIGLLLSPFCLFAQNDPAYPSETSRPVRPAGDSEPFKGANTITLATTDADAFGVVGRILTDEGYEVKANREFGSITTDAKTLPKQPVYGMTIKAVIKEGSVRMSALLHSGMGVYMGGITAKAGDMPVEYRTSNLTVYRMAFLELDRIARMIADEVKAESLKYSIRR